MPKDKTLMECIEFEDMKLRDKDAILLFKQTYEKLSKGGGWRYGY